MARRTTRRTVAFKALKVLYAVLGFFVVGYFPTLFLLERGGRQISMVGLALLVIPYGIGARSVVRGCLLGAVLGFWGGLATSYALIYQDAVHGPNANRLVGVAILGTMCLCAAVAGLFAHLAGKRADRIERDWR